MNKVTPRYGLYIQPQILNELRGLTQKNIEDLVKASTVTFGVVTKKLVGGTLDTDLKVEASGVNLKINPGYIITTLNGEVMIIEIPLTTIPMSDFSTDIVYTITISPKLSSYETGLLKFTNGSYVVEMTSKTGDFSKLSPYEYIVVDSSISGNNGQHQIAKITGGKTLELVSLFGGTTEDNLKWKIGGNFGSDGDLATPDKSIYYYDSYDIQTSISRGTGIVLAQFSVGAGPVIQTLNDLRLQNLFSLKGVYEVNADDVKKGLSKDITTIEEKAKAARVDKISNDIVKGGIVSGFGVTINNATTFTIGAGAGYDDTGIRVESTVTIFDMAVLQGEGKVVIDSYNYLHIYYVSPGSFGWYWNNTGISNNPSHIFIAKVYYSSGSEVEL